jgi:glutathione S-transferase
VLIEFINDLITPTGKALLPADPVKRANARFFIETFQSKFGAAWYGALARGENPAGILPALDAIVGLLPADESSYAIGSEWSLADAAVTPFLARAFTSLKHDIGGYDEGLGKAVYDKIQNEPKYDRLKKYFALVTSRDSFKSTYFEVCFALSFL